MTFTFNNELYQIETCDHNKLHLFSRGTLSARHVLRHCIPELLQKYPRAITQRINTHSFESFVTLLKAYICGSYSYECTDINCYSCKHNVMWFFTVLVAYTSIWWLYFSHNYIHVTHARMFLCLYGYWPCALPQSGLYVSGQAWP